MTEQQVWIALGMVAIAIIAGIAVHAMWYDLARKKWDWEKKKWDDIPVVESNVEDPFYQIDPDEPADWWKYDTMEDESEKK